VVIPSNSKNSWLSIYIHFKNNLVVMLEKGKAAQCSDSREDLTILCLVKWEKNRRKEVTHTHTQKKKRLRNCP